MTWRPYRGERYLDADEVDRFLDELASAAPDWVSVETIGTSRGGRPLRLVTVGDRRGDPSTRPAVWVDGGTHAVEWTGVMSALFTLSSWVEALLAGDPRRTDDFRRHTAYVVPCISPDGLQATFHGEPPFRSTLRPPRSSTVRSGFEPMNISGGPTLRWMRWRHPAGAWVPVAGHPVAMRPRTVDDDPADAWFMCDEGEFVAWDGQRWVVAPLRYGQDLNRNFPVDWEPFGMFGMDAGAFPGSEPESRAVLDAVAARETIAAAVTNHTYTGCLLTPPSRKDCPLTGADASLMQRLAKDLVEGTGYRTFKVYPEFMYDPEKPIIGTWDDTLSSTFGIAAFTLELWDPYGWAGVPMEDPVSSFKDPDQAALLAIVDKAVAEGMASPWAPFDHPQLGPVELGGIDYLRTVRNPPEPLLAAECAKGHAIADRLRRALPDVRATLSVEGTGELRVATLVLENVGALSTSSLARGEAIGAAPAVRASLVPGPGQRLVDAPEERRLHHLDGWFRHGFDRSPVYPELPGRGQRAVARWVIAGDGPVEVWWSAGRAGSGTIRA